MKLDKSLILSICIFLIVLVSSFVTFEKMENQVTKEDLERIETSIQDGIVQCYSTEGCYPESIEYLKSEYGIYVNESQYQIHYRYLGSNIMPEFKVFIKEDVYE